MPARRSTQGHGYWSVNVQVAGRSGCEKTTSVGFLNARNERPTGTGPHYSTWRPDTRFALVALALRLLDIPFVVSMYSG